MTGNWMSFAQPSPPLDPGEQAPFSFRPDMSSYPMVASTDCSPTGDAFSIDKSYLAHSISARPNHLLGGWPTTDFYDQPQDSIEFPTEIAVAEHKAFHNVAVSAPLPMHASAHLNQWQQAQIPVVQRSDSRSNVFATDFAYTARPSDRYGSDSTSPRASSPTPSLCGDGPQTLRSPALSQTSFKRESPENFVVNENPAQAKPQRKRGRPRLNRSETDPERYGQYSKQSRRLPHNQVEKKYREGLNSELERLRRAVPTLPQRDSTDLSGPPKPSKATVLASAIDYIKSIEAERDRLLEENEKLKESQPTMADT